MILIGILTFGILMIPALIALSFLEGYLESDQHKVRTAARITHKRERRKRRGKRTHDEVRSHIYQLERELGLQE